MTAPDQTLTDAPTLLAIARAAHQSGNRDLERAARRLLRDEHGIDVTFRRPVQPTDATSAAPKGGAE